MRNFSNLEVYRPVTNLKNFKLQELRDALSRSGYVAPEVLVAGIDTQRSPRLDAVLLGEGEYRRIQDQTGLVSQEETAEIVEYLDLNLGDSLAKKLKTPTFPVVVDQSPDPRYSHLYTISVGNDGELLDEKQEVHDVLQDYWADTGRNKFDLLDNDRNTYPNIISTNERKFAYTHERIVTFLTINSSLLPVEICYAPVVFSYDTE